MDFHRANQSWIATLAGRLPAFLALIPILNLAVPIFATAYFTHLLAQLQKS